MDPHNILRVGTDCSGIEAPIQALEQLGIPYQHVWSSDIDKHCIQSIKANYEPERLYGDSDGPYPDGDIRNRDPTTLPDVDLYVCGFPCQPFSSAGKQLGLEDQRGNIFWSCLDVIKAKQPKYFILENVKGLLWNDKEHKKDKYGRTWKTIWSSLQELEALGYTVDWKILNTKDYGIPQNRERVYIVGTKGQFEWPEEKEMESLEDYIDWGDIHEDIILSNKYNNYIDNAPRGTLILNMSYCGIPNRKYSNNTYSSCLTTTGTMWCYPLNRYINIKERRWLQGFSNSFQQVVSDTQLKKQLGNSMSVNVLVAILQQLIYHV